MASELSMTCRLTVDESITFVSQEVEFIDFDNWVQHNGGTKGNAMSRVDLMAKAPEESPVQWLVEVKDFRRLSRTPNDRNIAHLHETLRRKIIDSLDYMASDEAPAALASIAPSCTKPNFVFHCELPPAGEYRYVFPTNYPLSAIQQLRSLLPPERVGLLFAVNAEQLENHPDIPWRAELNDCRSNHRHAN